MYYLLRFEGIGHDGLVVNCKDKKLYSFHICGTLNIVENVIKERPLGEYILIEGERIDAKINISISIPEEPEYNTRKILVKPEILIKYLDKTVILAWGERSVPAKFHRIFTDKDEKKILKLYFQVAPEESITNPYVINVEEFRKDLNVAELHLYEIGVLAFTK